VATGSSQNRRTALLNGALQAGMATMPESLSLEAQGFHTLVDLTALDLPVTVQMTNGMTCWEATYQSNVILNDPDRFKAKAE